MDPLSNVPLYDLQLFLLIPLAILTIRDAKKNWRQLWDNDLSMQDRQLLQRINVILLLPLVVLLHECGHAVATLWAGARVQEFHFGGWWGYVVPVGNLTPEQDLIIFLAGNLVEVVIGLIALIAALFISSPPVVALLVYLGLYSIAATLIIYTLMSFAGMYGDWIAIYTAPLPAWVFTIGVVHGAMVVGLLYLIYGSAPRIWFVAKTRPKWAKDYQRAQELVSKDPTAINYLNLAWNYYYVDLEKQCRKALEMVAEKDPNLLERYMLAGVLQQSKGDFTGAVHSFEQVVERPEADPVLKTRSLMAIGHCLLAEVERQQGEKALTPAAVAHVLETYDQAAKLTPQIADPRFYKATVLNKVGLHKEAEQELKELRSLKWFDPALSELLGQEFQVARKSDKAQQ